MMGEQEIFQWIQKELGIPYKETDVVIDGEFTVKFALLAHLFKEFIYQNKELVTKMLNEPYVTGEIKYK